MKTHLLPLSLPLALVAACSSGGPADPNRPETLGASQAAVKVGLVGKATRLGVSTAAPRTLADGSTLVFTEAHVGLARVGVGSGAQGGTFDADLLANTTRPALPAIVAEAGRHDHVEIKVAASLAGGYAVIVRGVWTPAGGGAGVMVEYRSRRARDLVIRNATGFSAEARQLTRVIVALDLDRWFRRLDLQRAHRAADGTIRLGDGENADLEREADDDMEGAGEAGEDEDDNGRLSGSESGHSCGGAGGAGGAGGDQGAAGAGGAGTLFDGAGGAGGAGDDHEGAGGAGDDHEGAGGAGGASGDHDDGEDDDGEDDDDDECGEDDRDGGGVHDGEHEDDDHEDDEHEGAGGAGGAGGDDHDGAGGAGGAGV